MRSQWCREHIDETAANCGLSDDTVSDVKRAAKLCASAPEYSDCSTAAIMALIRIRDDPVRDKAISSVSNALKSGKHPLTGQIMKDKKLPEKTIKKVIQQVEREVRGDLTKKYERERKEKPEQETQEDPLPVSPYVPQPGSIEVSGTIPPSLAEQMKEPEACTSPPAPNKSLPASWITDPPKDPEAIKQAARVELEERAERLLEVMPKSTQLAVTDQLREHSSWKVKDCFYYGIEALAEKRVKK